MKIFAFGSSIVSSYWNGAATYYRGCYKYLERLGHTISFAEPDAYGRQQHRDSDDFSYVESLVYQPGTGMDAMLARAASADVIVKHSGIGVDDKALERRILELQSSCAITFWDVDAPATIARMHADPGDAFRTSMPQYDAVLTYGGGPWCREQYLALGARAYFSMYNGLDPETHHPVPARSRARLRRCVPRESPSRSRGTRRSNCFFAPPNWPQLSSFCWEERVGATSRCPAMSVGSDTSRRRSTIASTAPPAW